MATPLATGAQDVHQAVGHASDVDSSFVPTGSGWRDQRRDLHPFGVRQIARVMQSLPVVSGSAFDGPHQAPRELVPAIESHRNRIGQEHM